MNEILLAESGEGMLEAIDEALEATALAPADALRMQATARALLELSPGRGARLLEEPTRVALELRLGPEADAGLAMEIVARFGGSMSNRVEEDAEGGLTVTLGAERSEACPRGPRAPRETPTWSRIASLLDRVERRDAELSRLRHELDETNRGVVALYAELDNHSRELELADRRKNEFLAMLAHELRNPLAALHLAAEDLEADPDRASKAADVMQRQLVHLARMVDDLLDVSRITRGKVEIDPQRLDLVHAVRQAVQPRITIAAEADLELTLELPDEAVYVRGDPTRLEQVVVNLVDNAIKYSTGPGRIGVTVSATEREAEVAVSDQGRGMTDEELRDAFDLFVQHSAHELDRSRGGLGIGLTLVREIVAMHSGTITAESEGPGHGTTFRVRLPLSEEHREAAEQRDEAPRDASCPVRLLLVEDNEDFRELLAARLRRRGCEVDEAGDGAEALEALRRGPLPDAVVTDVGLPGMDGYTLTKAIRNDPRLSQLKVVALTGYGGDAAAERTRAAGFDSHLVKPVPIDELMATLRS